MSYVYRPAAGKPLTERETKILELVVGGHSFKGVARIMGCAQETVKTHFFRIRHKLGAKNNEQAAAIFAREKVKEEI